MSQERRLSMSASLMKKTTSFFRRLASCVSEVLAERRVNLLLQNLLLCFIGALDLGQEGLDPLLILAGTQGGVVRLGLSHRECV